MKVLFLLSLIATGYCGVPVLIWETSGSNKGDDIPALSHLDTDDFSNFIVKKVHSHKPLVVLFEEETLSIEDFSWQDSQRKGSFPKLQNLTSMSGKVQFLPSVLDPVSALKDLVRSHDYVWKKYEKNGPSKPKMVLEVKMKDPLPNEDRPDLLRSHDTQIAEIYSNLLASNSRIIAIFTGKHSSWVEVDVNRVRREAKNEEEPLVYENNRIKIELSKNMTLTTSKSTYVLGKPTGTVGGDERDKSAKLVMTFSAPEKNDSSEKTGITLRPKFEEEGNEWNFKTIEIVINGETDTLSAMSSIKANMGKSFKTSSDVVFKNAPGNISLVMNGLKAQLYNKGEPKALDKKFSQSDSSGEMFFTAPILSGLLVSFILISILTYGFVMLSDIKTMDRFDDPKGKTIQVNAAQD